MADQTLTITGSSSSSSSSSTSSSSTDTDVSAEQVASALNNSLSSLEAYAGTTAGLWTNKPLRLFGAPYQFTRQVDPLYKSAFEYMGRAYGDNIMAKSCVVTLIPGKPYYLPGGSAEIQKMTSYALINQSSLKSALSNVDTSDKNNMRYYDFQTSYYEYMNYVNLLCRALALLLDLDEVTFDNVASDGTNSTSKFTIDGTAPSEYSWDVFPDGGTATDSSRATLSGADYADGKATYAEYQESISATGASYISSDGTYKFEKDDYGTYTKYRLQDDGSWKEVATEVAASRVANQVNTGNITAEIIDEDSETTEVDDIDSAGTFGSALADYVTETLEDMASGMRRYVQFYIDPDSAGSQEQHSNTTTESTLKSTIDAATSSMKELAFVVNSGGLDSMGDAFSGAIENIESALNTAFSSDSSSITSALSRVLNLTTNVINGENIIIPKIYESSAFGQTYNFTVHLKALYGSKVGWFWDVGVPLMHLLALTIPKQATANTYESPFLVKAYVDGVYSCNLGIVNSLQINKSVSSTSWTVDGLPNEIDVEVTLEDLYSDLSINSTTQPTMFYYNTSLVDYLAVTCGLSLVSPDLETKANLYVSTYISSIKGIPKTISGAFLDEVYAKLENNTNINLIFGASS